MPESGFFRGAGGGVFELPLPLGENYENQRARGELVQVNADGTALAEQPPAVKEPAKSASKTEWIGYARAVDPELSIDDADAMTRNDLAEKYGSK